jgi:aspartate/tyrosine/aromatic aminotransferase
LQAVYQTVGESSRAHSQGATVYISNPTWGNHRNIFSDEGVKWEYYRWVGRMC